MHRTANRTRLGGALGVFALAALLPATGCATRGRVAELEQRVAALESRVDDVNATAERAAGDAQAAQAAAERAADRADDAARTAEAIFRKGVSK